MWVFNCISPFFLYQGEDEADGEDDEEDDDGFFVPHGYLSDDEGVEEDGSSVEIDEKVLESTACLLILNQVEGNLYAAFRRITCLKIQQQFTNVKYMHHKYL